eukprot:m.20445 g.20445  ORF g.20445 m.20445 type:complete len:69 (-) comp3836_c0_seq2:1575-1781(-)
MYRELMKRCSATAAEAATVKQHLDATGDVVAKAIAAHLDVDRAPGCSREREALQSAAGAPQPHSPRPP